LRRLALLFFRERDQGARSLIANGSVTSRITGPWPARQKKTHRRRKAASRSYETPRRVDL
jgi:hypothetical protein